MYSMMTKVNNVVLTIFKITKRADHKSSYHKKKFEFGDRC